MENQEKYINGPNITLKTSASWLQDDLSLLRKHIVTFEFADAGCIIQVGCKKFCFSDNIVALNEFRKYVENPREAYETWNNLSKLN